MELILGYLFSLGLGWLLGVISLILFMIRFANKITK